MFDSIFADGELKQFLLSKNENTKWINTPFEKYSNLTTKTKGEFGELFVKKYLSLKGHHIAKRKNSGHDCLVDNIKTEIKFSLDGVINHVSLYKDWERIIFCFIKQPEEDSLIIYMNKDDFTKHMSSGYSVFNRQQGGKNSNNDDYMCGEKDLILLKSTGQAKCITEWIAKNSSKEFIITKRNTIEDYAI